MPQTSNTEATFLIQEDSGYGGTSNAPSSDVEGGQGGGHSKDSHHSAVPSVKSIGMLGSMAIAVNALCGPAILQLPATFQDAGIIPTTAALIMVGVLSSLCSLHMANVVSKVPGNRAFDKEVEFSEPFRVFWGKRAFVITQVLFYLCTVCLNIAAIVDTAEVVDTFIGHTSGGSYGLQFDDLILEIVHWQHGPCSRRQVKRGMCAAFGSDKDEHYGQYILTLGYLVAAIVFLPVCLMDLKENSGFQIFGFFVLLFNSLQFVISFCMYGLKFSHVPVWGANYGRMLGVIIFNFSLVVAIPAWLHEKQTNVSVPKVVYGSTLVTTVLYVLVGLGGALAIPNVNPNLLAPLVSGAFGEPLRIGASLFAFIIIGLDIPLFCVLTRYNLVNSGLCTARLANWLVVYIPWGLSWIFYQGSAIATLLSWGGVLFASAVAFILPLALALYMLIYEADVLGTIDVDWQMITSQSGKKVAVAVLMVTAIASVTYAFVGLL